MATRKIHSSAGRIPWRCNGVWLGGDTHAHYRNVGVERLAAEASPFCDFIAITSHSHRPNFWRPQHAEVVAARKAHPNLLIFHGLEWGCPVGGHATVLVERSRSENAILSEFWRTYDGWYARAKPDTVQDAIAGLRFLAGASRRAQSAAILNHPSYGRSYTADDMRAMYGVGGLCVTFEGACGKQSRTPGSEIDPIVRKVGGTYDVLLAEGRKYGLVAVSDFHSHVADGGRNYWPGEFAKTYVYCPERSHRGVLAGIKAGATYFVHNDIIGPLRLAARSGEREAMLGETLRVPRGAEVEIVLDCIERSPIDRVEFITNDRSPSAFHVVKRKRRQRIGRWSRFSFTVPEAGQDFFVRARGVARGMRKPFSDEPGDMWFYTSAILIQVT